ncbi:MAG: barstar family protein [Chloroflexi bacterium]|nr:barstar family protein [Chloroflexota bacterium]
MTNWIDVTEVVPGLNKGQWLHIVKSPSNPLVNTLSEHGFSVFVIEGAEISDSKSFFRQVRKVFDFPDYFGENWDAWDECLDDFKLSLTRQIAIVWKDADQTFISDAKVFIQAVIDLYNMALSAGSIKNSQPHQVELFLMGNLEGFKNALDFKRE